MTPWLSVVGGVTFIVTIRLIGVCLGHHYRCRLMRRYRIACGVVLYGLAILAIVSGLMERGRGPLTTNDSNNSPCSFTGRLSDK